MILIRCIVLGFLFCSSQLLAQDTLNFRLSNPWNTVKDPNGNYLRKAVLTDSGWLALDYNQKGILVTRSFYTDTNFNRKLHCHQYFNETKGYFEGLRCYVNGRLHGIRAGFGSKGDTLWRENYVENTLVDSKDFTGKRKAIVMTVVETEAQFPGGKKAWIQYLTDHIRYPREAEKKKITGTVLVSFVVNETGNITDVKVVEPVHPLLDAEAVRLVQNSPQWTPAVQNGKK